MNFKLVPKTYEEITQVIHGGEIPVGIDVKKRNFLSLINYNLND